jgi:hypothetical protein
VRYQIGRFSGQSQRGRVTTLTGYLPFLLRPINSRAQYLDAGTVSLCSGPSRSRWRVGDDANIRCARTASVASAAADALDAVVGAVPVGRNGEGRARGYKLRRRSRGCSWNGSPRGSCAGRRRCGCRRSCCRRRGWGVSCRRRGGRGWGVSCGRRGRRRCSCRGRRSGGRSWSNERNQWLRIESQIPPPLAFPISAPHWFCR